MDETRGYNTACFECRRRKQKCNRQFPCNHCLKRGVAHLCRFKVVSKSSSSASASGSSVCDPASSSGPRKRTIDESEHGGTSPPEIESSDAEDVPFDASSALNALGYMPHTHHLVLSRGRGTQDGGVFIHETEESGHSAELQVALAQVPLKQHSDILVNNWLYGANYHYYALYPPQFRTEYEAWWVVPINSRTPEMTSLILRVCACSALFLTKDGDSNRLELELNEDALAFAGRMHRAAEALSASIQHGKGGLPHVQQLFLTAFWLKSAEKWTEAWYALSAAIRAAYEIGLYQDSSSDGLSEFDREMRRRMWCILYLWDFALSSMLSRPMIINSADCAFEMPTLALEMDPGQPHQPSPFRHMKLHCLLCVDMSKVITSVAAEKASTELAPRLRHVIEEWLACLPREYAASNPDTRWDGDHDWVVFQRRYLHLIGYMSLFGSLKAYVTQSSAASMSRWEDELRRTGIRAALDLMDVSWDFYENVASTGAKFHYAVFCIFDTTTVLCSAFIHDESTELPQRGDVLQAIKKGLGMLQRLRSVSKTTADLCRILNSLLATLPLSDQERELVGLPERPKPETPSPSSKRAKRSRVPKKKAAKSPLSQEITQEGSGVCAAADGEEAATEVAEQGGISSSPCSSSSSNASSLLLYEARAGMSSTAVPATLLHEEGQLEAVGLPTSLQDNTSPLYPHDVSDPCASAPGPSSLDSVHQPPLEASDFQPESFGAAVANHGEGYGPGDAEMLPNPNLVAFDPTMPTVLEYWDWQGLDLGHPGYWGNAPSPM